jgi:hypothetical protein
VTVPTTPPTFAWNHGSIDPEIATTWLGMVGPGVRNNGADNTWADHTDTRPTMLSLLGLDDTYVHDGRVLIDQLDDSALPEAVLAHRDAIRRLGAVYKQLNAPFGDFSQATLVMSTNAIKSETTDDKRYNSIEDQIAGLTQRRDALAQQIRDALDDAAFAGTPPSDRQAKVWIKQAQALIAQAKSLAAAS